MVSTRFRAHAAGHAAAVVSVTAEVLQADMDKFQGNVRQDTTSAEQKAEEAFHVVRALQREFIPPPSNGFALLTGV